jgi:acetolactate synthase I/II/III large subunit
VETVTSSSKTGGWQVATFLKRAGVAEVYGIPGGHTLGLNDGLNQVGIPFLTTRHEYTAGCAAAARGRLTGRAGVALVTCGPGVTNITTAVAGAQRDGQAMLVLSVNNRAEHIGWGDAQDADANAVLGSLCKWSVHVTRAQAIGPTLRRAWRIAHSDRPGVVHLDFARDVIEGPHHEADAQTPVPDIPAPPEPDAAALDAVAVELARARRPVLWIGRGALDALHGGALAPLVQRLRIPVVCTFNAMEAAGAFGDLSYGVLSRVGTRLASGIVEGADLVICLGNSLNGVSTRRWSLRLPRSIQVEIQADRMSDRYTPALSVWADAGRFCRALLPRLVDAGDRHSDWLAECAARRTDWHSRFLAGAGATSGQFITPLGLMALFERLGLDDGGHWCIDASNAGIWAHALNFRNGARVIRPVHFSNMGASIGSAIGMARSLGTGQPVNVLIGDGSLGMHLGDLETIRRLRLPVRIFVMNDASLGNIRQEVMHKYEQVEHGFDFTDVRFDAVAAAMGIEARRLDCLADLEQDLRTRGAPQAPVLYDLTLDRGPSVWTDMV